MKQGTDPGILYVRRSYTKNVSGIPRSMSIDDNIQLGDDCGHALPCTTHMSFGAGYAEFMFHLPRALAEAAKSPSVLVIPSTTI